MSAKTTHTSATHGAQQAIGASSHAWLLLLNNESTMVRREEEDHELFAPIDQMHLVEPGCAK